MHTTIIKTVEKRRDEIMVQLMKNPLFRELQELTHFIKENQDNTTTTLKRVRAKSRPSPLLKINHGNRLVTIHNAVMNVIKESKDHVAALDDIVEQLREEFGIRFPRGSAGAYISNYLSLYVKSHRELGHKFEFLTKEGGIKKGRDRKKISTIKLVVDKRRNKVKPIEQKVEENNAQSQTA